MQAVNDLVKALKPHGFEFNEDQRQERELIADAEKRRDNGPYEVHAVLQKGEVTITVEQNTQLGVTMPPVAIIEGPDYRVACNPEDHELVLSETAKAAGEEPDQ